MKLSDGDSAGELASVDGGVGSFACMSQRMKLLTVDEVFEHVGQLCRCAGGSVCLPRVMCLYCADKVSKVPLSGYQDSGP